MKAKTLNKLKKLNHFESRKLRKIRKDWMYYWSEKCKTYEEFPTWEEEFEELVKWAEKRKNENKD